MRKTITISDSTAKRLDIIAKREGITHSQLIEKLISIQLTLFDIKNKGKEKYESIIELPNNTD